MTSNAPLFPGFLGLFVVLSFALRGLAQTTLTAHSTDAGGGSSTGGRYALAGTIGQQDAGTLSGKTYTLEGGLWPGLVTRVVVPGGPTLLIVASDGSVTVSWSPNTPGFVLQEASNPEGSWTPSPTGSQNPVTLPATAESRFLRLARP